MIMTTLQQLQGSKEPVVTSVYPRTQRHLLAEHSSLPSSGSRCIEMKLIQEAFERRAVG